MRKWDCLKPFFLTIPTSRDSVMVGVEIGDKIESCDGAIFFYGIETIDSITLIDLLKRQDYIKETECV